MKLSDIPGIILDNILVPADEVAEYIQDKLEQNGISEFEHSLFQFIVEFFNDSPSIIQKTSGTTGTPKELELSKESMLASAVNTNKFLGLKPFSTLFLCLPIEYIAGKMMVVRAIAGQHNLMYTEPSSMPEIKSHLPIHLCAMVPLQAFNIFSDFEMLQSLKNLLVGGAEIRPELEEMLRTLNEPVYETFGMAETYSHIALRRVNGENRTKIFTAMDGVLLSVDERQCLIVDAPYLNRPVVTDDIVELIDEHQFRWKGRFDNVINTGGKKVHPELLEEKIANSLNVASAVIGIDDHALGKRIVIVVDRRCNIPDELLHHQIQEVLPRHFQPKEIHRVDEFPYNPSMKIDRLKLYKLITNA